MLELAAIFALIAGLVILDRTLRFFEARKGSPRLPSGRSAGQDGLPMLEVETFADHAAPARPAPRRMSSQDCPA